MEPHVKLGVKIADAGALGTLLGWVGLHIADITLWVQLIGGLVVVVSGIAATWYHIKAGRRLK